MACVHPDTCFWAGSGDMNRVPVQTGNLDRTISLPTEEPANDSGIDAWLTARAAAAQQPEL